MSTNNWTYLFNCQTSIKLKMLGQIVAISLTEGQLDVSETNIISGCTITHVHFSLDRKKELRKLLKTQSWVSLTNNILTFRSFNFDHSFNEPWIFLNQVEKKTNMIITNFGFHQPVDERSTPRLKVHFHPCWYDKFLSLGVHRACRVNPGDMAPNFPTQITHSIILTDRWAFL